MNFRSSLASLWLLLLVAGIPSHAQSLEEKGVEVEVVSTVPLGLVHLLQSAAGTPGFLPAPFQVLGQQRPFSDEEKAVLERAFPLLLDGQVASEGVVAVLREEAFANSDLRDFLAALESRLTEEQYSILEPAFLLVAEDYERLIHAPASQRLEGARSLIEAQFASPQARELFELLFTFYQAPLDQHLRVGLVPLPPTEQNGWAALPLSQGILLQLPPKDVEQTVGGVVFHEIVHLFQRATEQEELVRTFTRAGSSQAGMELNEAVATVFGNWLFPLRVNGKEPQGALYSDPFVEKYARAMIALLERYLEERRSFDSDFVAAAVDAYRTAYAESVDEPAYVFRHSWLTSPQDLMLASSTEVRLAASRHPRSIKRRSLSSQESRAEIEESTLTVITVLTRDQLSLDHGLSPEGYAALSQAEGGIWGQKEGQRWRFFVLSESDPETRFRNLWRLVTQPTLAPGLLAP